jgi:hypothetical protein
MRTGIAANVSEAIRAAVRTPWSRQPVGDGVQRTLATQAGAQPFRIDREFHARKKSPQVHALHVRSALFM